MEQEPGGLELEPGWAELVDREPQGLEHVPLVQELRGADLVGQELWGMEQVLPAQDLQGAKQVPPAQEPWGEELGLRLSSGHHLFQELRNLRNGIPHHSGPC